MDGDARVEYWRRAAHWAKKIRPKDPNRLRDMQVSLIHKLRQFGPPSGSRWRDLQHRSSGSAGIGMAVIPFHSLPFHLMITL